MTKCSQAFDLDHAPRFGACSELVFEVQRGLLTWPRSLVPWMFYDELGSGLFERITAYTNTI
jgi:L-histidine Nalpha-methyltransferase